MKQRGSAVKGVLVWRIAMASAVCWAGGAIAIAADQPRPNILWLTSEDHGPHMGCYGDRYATTPNVDRLAARGVTYTRCWSNAPVCAPARTTLISGLYPTSTGSEHMRSMVPYPAGKQMFPQLLRAAGYYCTNNAKEDYNLEKPGQVWDVSGRGGHWKSRAAGQPFFAVFNSTKSHESQIRTRPHHRVHDPAAVRVPAYHPDTPEVREDWAQYYDKVSEADADAGARLGELDEAGLADETIVFYFADHGSGMPRNKRWPYHSGLHVPLVVYIPDRFKHLRSGDYVAGGTSQRLVSFVDFAPTVLSLAGIAPPEWLEGHAFLGAHAAKPRPYVYGFRGRMDERIDLVRSVTDGRYVYVRNYMPHRIYGQHLDYMWQTPTTRVWERLHREGKLTAAQDAFWNTKPPQELYDLASDPDEVHNLAASAEHAEILQRLRAAQQDLAKRIGDVGFLPEGEMHERSRGTTPYDMARDGATYPLDRIWSMAELASGLKPEATPALVKAFEDGDGAVRYWAAMGLLMRGREAVAEGRGTLAASLADPSPYVRIVAAEALGRFGEPADRALALRVLADHADSGRHGVFVAIAALNALDQLGQEAEAIKADLRKAPQRKAPHARYESYVPRLLEESMN
jgi:uncharacterized sulfatase